MSGVGNLDWASRLALIVDPDAAAAKLVSHTFFERGGFPELARLLEAVGLRPATRAENVGMPNSDVQKLLAPLGLNPNSLGKALKQLGVVTRWKEGLFVYNLLSCSVAKSGVC